MRVEIALAGWMVVSAAAAAAVPAKDWGEVGGRPVHLYTLASKTLTVRVTDYGARLVSVEAPDAQGKRADVVLGFDDVGGYVADDAFIGAIVGRYGNRIAKGAFTLDGKAYQVPVNNNGNALHGGPEGFDKKVWKATADATSVTFTLHSPDGEMGFPGTLDVTVKYVLEGSALRIEYSAVTDAPTVLNLTNHAYFNLTGDAQRDVLGHELEIVADAVTPTDATQIPTGEIRPVVGTPFDFRKATAIGARIDADDAQMRIGSGYDHNFVLKKSGAGLQVAAVVREPASGRTLTVETTQPAVQLYTGQWLKGKYKAHAGFCLETQHYPDSPNHAAFPSTVLRPEERFSSVTVYRFGVEKR